MLLFFPFKLHIKKDMKLGENRFAHVDGEIRTKMKRRKLECTN